MRALKPLPLAIKIWAHLLRHVAFRTFGTSRLAHSLAVAGPPSLCLRLRWYRFLLILCESFVGR
jgi:hypothetical protein